VIAAMCAVSRLPGSSMNERSTDLLNAAAVPYDLHHTHGKAARLVSGR